MDKIFMRAFCERGEGTAQEEGTPIRFTASTVGLARDGWIIEAEGWKLENYRKNPVVLWAHDYWGRNLPIGKTINVAVEGEKLVADIQFDAADEFAKSIDRKYRTGFLNAVSVGWDTIEFKPGKEGSAPTITGAELLDISAVPVPGDPDALIERQYRALRAILEGDEQKISQRSGKRRALPPHTTEKADEDAEWNGAAEVSKADGATQLKRMHAWIDDEGDEETKQSYKLPHHLAEDGKVVWRGVAAAMSRLLQAGTEIPDDDRRGVYNHLERHYKQFDKEAPEFRTIEDLKALDDEAWRGMFLEGELEEESIPPEGFDELAMLLAMKVRLNL